ncbi:hypothetical protein C8J56DRAFT_970892 [Mycena floridula]|nr:hypothetical protein C8J56DRAFT_970892 [Mycena floridula]
MSGDNVTITFPDSGELPSDYDFERTLLIGSFLGCLAWGVHLATYGAAMYLVFTKFVQARQLQRSTFWAWALMLYMTILLAMSTTYIGTNIQANVDMYITHRNDPGGPLAYALATFNSPLVLVGNNICPVISIFLTDALLVWRLYVIWGIFWTLVLPILMFLASTVMGILLIYTSALPGHIFNSLDAVKFGTAYFSISLSLTVIVTLTIVFRLLYLQRETAKALGNTPEYQDHYISAWTILLESFTLYAVIGFIFLILYHKSNAVSNIFLQLMVQLMCVSADLVILRVAIGSAWTARQSENITSVIFRQHVETSLTDIESLPGKSAQSPSHSDRSRVDGSDTFGI